MKISDKFHLEDIYKLKNTVLTGKTEDIKWRIHHINIVSKLLDENKKEIIKSLFVDLGKSEIEGLSEILLVKEEISLIKKKLNSWMRPKKIDTPFYLFPSSSKVIYEPLGCVLILGPYNYPLLYILKPLVNIFSAGNTAVIKPSEKCPATSKLIKKLTSKYFRKDVLMTVEGDNKQSIKLIEQNFDHIFFTGSTETGKSIMKLASKNLTPLTLELSGTNPVIVFKNANLEVAAKRIVWGKFFNSGQSCMAPNHIFVDKEIENIFIEKLKKYIVSFYGDNPIISENLSKLYKKQFSSTVKTFGSSDSANSHHWNFTFFSLYSISFSCTASVNEISSSIDQYSCVSSDIFISPYFLLFFSFLAGLTAGAISAATLVARASVLKTPATSLLPSITAYLPFLSSILYFIFTSEISSC